MAIKKFEVLMNNVKVGDVPKPASHFVRLAVMLPVLRGRHTSAIIKAINDTGFAVKPSLPFMLPVKGEPGACYIYPNIKASAAPVDVVSQIKGWIADPKTALRVETSERASKLALKREKTTLAKVLTEHTNILEKYTDAKVRDVATAVSVELNPAKIVLCKKPEDYYTMYKVKNGSCMTVGTTWWGTSSSKDWVNIAEETGFYPSAWYHFQPHAKGGYLESGGVPVCRFMLYRTDLTKDEWPYYGDMKYENGTHYNKAKKMLEDLGKKPQAGQSKTIAPYSVPGILHKALGKEYHCPIPHCDGQADDFSAAFDQASNTFLFDNYKNQPKWTKIDNYKYTGYIPASEIFNLVAETVAIPVAPEAPVKVPKVKHKTAVEVLAGAAKVAKPKVRKPIATLRVPKRAEEIKAPVVAKIPRSSRAEELPVLEFKSLGMASPHLVIIG